MQIMLEQKYTISVGRNLFKGAAKANISRCVYASVTYWSLRDLGWDNEKVCKDGSRAWIRTLL